jgi:hypothetical protein
MESFGEAQKRKLRPPPESWSMKDKFLVCGAFATALLVFTLPPFLSTSIRHRNAIDRRLKDWKIEYALTESEVLRLREIEMSFHRPNLLGAPKPLTSEQLAQHNQHLAGQMNAESARKFTENQRRRQVDH